jgi:methylthioribose-1-phosphate isomerase
MIQPLLIGISILTLLILIVVVFRETTIFATKVSTYQTVVIDKRKQTTFMVVPVFAPLETFSLISQEGNQIQVGQREYNRMNIGDTILVSEYSNGKYKLELPPL